MKKIFAARGMFRVRQRYYDDGHVTATIIPNDDGTALERIEKPLYDEYNDWFVTLPQAQAFRKGALEA